MTFSPGATSLSVPPGALSRSSTDFETRRVESPHEWGEVRDLRHRALRSRGDLAAGESLRDDGHDTALNTATHLLARYGKPQGSTRTSLSTEARRWPLPSVETFGREIESSIGWKATLVEASLSVVDPDLPGDPRVALVYLFKVQMDRCAAEDADWMLAAVPESQIGFHRRMFNMEILSGSEPYPGFALPRVLMGLDFRRHASVLFQRIPALAP
jgi:hypothetical protein